MGYDASSPGFLQQPDLFGRDPYMPGIITPQKELG